MESDCHHTEKDTLNRIAAGDEKAFVVLVRQFTPIVYSHILTYVKNAQRAEELTQDIFLKIWNNRAALSQVENFRGYLYTMVKHITISAFRQKILTWEESPRDELESPSLTPAGQMEYRQLSDILMQGIEQLPRRRKQVFCMSRFEGKTYEQIAQELNVSKSAVNQHIVESLVFLRTYLDGRMLSVAFGVILVCFPPK